MSNPDGGLIGVQTRLEQLTGDDADLLGYARADETDDGVYYLTTRLWPHPDVDGAWTVSIRYAYLTRGSGNDGWVGGKDSSGAAGINMRVDGDPATWLRNLARMCLATGKRVDNLDAPFDGGSLHRED